MAAELPSTEQIFSETSRLVPLKILYLCVCLSCCKNTERMLTAQLFSWRLIPLLMFPKFSGRSERRSKRYKQLLVCKWRHGSHVGGQKQKSFSPLGNEVYFDANFAKKFLLYWPPTWPPCHVVANEEWKNRIFIVQNLLIWKYSRLF